MKIFFWIFFLSGFFSLGAQQVEISNPSRLPNRTGKFKVIGKNNDGIIVRLYGTVDVINVYNDDLRLIVTKNIEFKNQDGMLQHIMLNKTGAVIFYLQQDKKYSVLFAQPVNSKFMEIGKAITIDTIFDRKDMVAQNLRFKTSADQNFTFIFYPLFSGGEVQTAKFICVDHSLKTNYNKLVPLVRDENTMEESKLLNDNEGNSFLILKPGKEKTHHTFDIFRISGNGEFSNYSITTEKEIFNEPWFETDNKNGNLVMCALYDDKKNSEDVANGFMYASFNPETGAPVKTKYTQFPKEFVNELTGRETKDEGKLYTFGVKKVILRNDGGALVLAESFIKDTRESAIPVGMQPGFNTYVRSTIYQYNDIIAFSLNPNGDLEWRNILHKKQSSEDDNGIYSSFFIANEKDKLRLLYLDDVSSSGILNQYILTSTGKADRAVIANQEEKDVFLLPKMGKQISPDEVVVPSYKNGELRLTKIIF